MNLLVPLVLIGWIPVVFLIFSINTPRKAVIISFMAAWMFLPIATYPIQGLPDYDKMFATSAAVLLFTLLFDSGQFRNFQLKKVDLFMLVWCLVPLASSLSNGLGTYDGMSGVLKTLVAWGFPYLIGRIYFRDFQDLNKLAAALVIGGLIYVPLCLFEVRMSPKLHLLLYGYHQHSFGQTMRFGGYRPMVFMQHGLMVAMWMTSATLIAVWLWRSRGLKQLGGIQMGSLALVLLVTAVLCKSLGALVLLGLGLLALYFARSMKSSLVLKGLMVLPLLYVTARVGFGWKAEGLLEAASMVNEERSSSLQTRLVNEDALIAKAMEQPYLGWGGWGRNRVYDEVTGKDRSITDGLWIITLGVHGIVGLVAVTGCILWPAFLLLRRIPAANWSHPLLAGPVGLAVLLVLYSIDNLFNAMVNPIYILAAGGIASTVGKPLPALDPPPEAVVPAA